MAEMLFDVFRVRRRIDVAVVLVYAGPSFRYAEWCSRACQAAGVPLVLWYHGGGLPDLASEAPERVRRLMQRGRDHVAPSEYLRREFRGTSRLRLCRWYRNLIDTDQLRFRQRPPLPRLLWMRSFGAPLPA